MLDADKCSGNKAVKRGWGLQGGGVNILKRAAKKYFIGKLIVESTDSEPADGQQRKTWDLRILGCLVSTGVGLGILETIPLRH